MTTQRIHRLALLLASTVSIALLGACSSGGGGGGGSSASSGGGSGGGGGGTAAPTLRILVTDAPFPFADVREAIVEVRELELRDTAGAFSTLVTFSPARQLDLVQLRNGAVDLLYEGSPAVGDYDLVRIKLSPVSITVNDNGTDKTFTSFRVPSGDTSGLKVFIDNVLSVQTSLTTDLVLDMDLGRSFIVQGNPNTPAGIRGFNFRPVIRATNSSTAGSLTFRTLSDNATPLNGTDDFYVNGADYTVWEPTALNGTAAASGASGTDPNDPSKDGYVLHPAITAGTYEVEVGLQGHDPAVEPATIVTANLTDLGDVVLAATSGMIEGVVTTELTTTNGTALSFAVDLADADATVINGTTPAATDTSNAMGQYALSPLAFGTYVVTASKAGYQDATTQATPWVFGAPGPLSVDLTLVALTDDVTGTVTDAGGSPVANATVQATVSYAGGTEVIAETQTAADGSYTLAGLPTGAYDIVATDGPLSGSEALTHTGGGGAATVDITVQ